MVVVSFSLIKPAQQSHGRGKKDGSKDGSM